MVGLPSARPGAMMAATTMVRLGAPALAVAIPAILVLAALPVLQLGDGTNLPQLALFLGCACRLRCHRRQISRRG